MGSKTEKFNTTKEYVKKVLQEDERARNDDKWLILKTLRKMGYDVYIDFEDMNEMPSFGTIKRVRRKLQEQGMYEPEQEILEKRSMNEEEVREYMRDDT